MPVPFCCAESLLIEHESSCSALLFLLLTNAYIYIYGASEFLAPLRWFQGCVVVLALSQSFLVVASPK